MGHPDCNGCLEQDLNKIVWFEKCLSSLLRKFGEKTFSCCVSHSFLSGNWGNVGLQHPFASTIREPPFEFCGPFSSFQFAGVPVSFVTPEGTLNRTWICTVEDTEFEAAHTLSHYIGAAFSGESQIIEQMY